MGNNDVVKAITIDGSIICAYVIVIKGDQSLAMIDLIRPFVNFEFLELCSNAIRFDLLKKGIELTTYQQSTYPRTLLKQDYENRIKD
jgi:hypothetical protein